VREERAVAEPDDLHAVERAEALGDLLGVLVVGDLDRELADRLVAGDGDRDDVADDPLALRDRARDPRQRADAVRDVEPVGAVERRQF
jgi:hypothetical protein